MVKFFLSVLMYSLEYCLDVFEEYRTKNCGKVHDVQHQSKYYIWYTYYATFVKAFSIYDLCRHYLTPQSTPFNSSLEIYRSTYAGVLVLIGCKHNSMIHVLLSIFHNKSKHIIHINITWSIFNSYYFGTSRST